MSFIQNAPRLEPFIIKDMLEKSKNGRSEVIIANTVGVTIFILFLNEGVEVSEHAPAGDALMQIQEGAVIVTVDGKEITLCEGQALVIPAGAKRGLKAQSDMKLQLTLVKDIA